MMEQVADAESSEGRRGTAAALVVAVGWDALKLGGLGYLQQEGLLSLLERGRAKGLGVGRMRIMSVGRGLNE